MNYMNGTNGNGRIEFLRAKEREIREALSAETAKLAKKRKRDEAKLFSIVGSALIREAQKEEDFRAKLIEALNVSVTDERERVFLENHGWL
jgi:hypothetical protein